MAYYVRFCLKADAVISLIPDIPQYSEVKDRLKCIQADARFSGPEAIGVNGYGKFEKVLIDQLPAPSSGPKWALSIAKVWMSKLKNEELTKLIDSLPNSSFQ